MDKNKRRIIMMYALIALIMLSSILVVTYIKKAGQCDLNPFTYMTQKSYDQGMELMCSCTPMDPTYGMFYFDKDGISFTKYNSYGIEDNNIQQNQKGAGL